MDALKLILFLIGTIAFFVAVYLATKYPKLAEATADASDESDDHQQIRRLDKLATGCM